MTDSPELSRSGFGPTLYSADLQVGERAGEPVIFGRILTKGSELSRPMNDQFRGRVQERVADDAVIHFADEITAGIMHDTSPLFRGVRADPIGAFSDGRLELKEVDGAVDFELSPNIETKRGQAALSGVELRKYPCTSFSFANARCSYHEGARADSLPIRPLDEFTITEVTLATASGAYYPGGTMAGVRAIDLDMFSDMTGNFAEAIKMAINEQLFRAFYRAIYRAFWDGIDDETLLKLGRMILESDMGDGDDGDSGPDSAAAMLLQRVLGMVIEQTSGERAGEEEPEEPGEEPDDTPIQTPTLDATASRLGQLASAGG